MPRQVHALPLPLSSLAFLLIATLSRFLCMLFCFTSSHGLGMYGPETPEKMVLVRGLVDEAMAKMHEDGKPENAALTQCRVPSHVSRLCGRTRLTPTLRSASVGSW